MNNNLSPKELEALLNGPALTPPAGVIPQLDNAPNYWVASMAILNFCVVVSTVLVAMRLYTRAIIIRQLNIADYSILFAWGVSMGEMTCAFLAMISAPGVHQWNVRLRDLRLFLYYFHIAAILYGICVFFIKFSILMQYIQIFMPVKKPRALYWATRILIVANFLYYSTGRFLEIFSCRPLAKAWDPLIREGHCIDIKALVNASASINTASNVLILALPQLIIWRLNLSRKEKAGISAIFLVAILYLRACACSGVSLFYTVRFRSQYDDTYNIWRFSVWNLLEITAGLAVACLPVAKAFFKTLPKVRGVSDIASYIRVGSWPRPSSQRNSPGNEFRNEFENQENGLAPNPSHNTLSYEAHDVAGFHFVQEFQANNLEASIQRVPDQNWVGN
ncbi:hypothetical protein F4811DRAFT_561393 [Daldinia bambusicola]|nr:hypothetical protein F4811DRAFT_561393 [Daldinia bambusicola]